MNGNGKRKKWRPEEKLRLVLAGMAAGVEIADLCRREGIHPTLYYGWRKQLLGSAAEFLETRRTSPAPARRACGSRIPG